MKIPIVVLKLLFLGALFIVSNHSLHLTDAGDRGLFVDYYTAWLENLFGQGVEVTGYVVKFEWLPNEENILFNNTDS